MQNAVKILIILVSFITTNAHSYELEVGWPFEHSADWAIGSAHRESSFCIKKPCTLHALDFFTYTSVRQWDKPQGSAPVQAMISGTVYKIDECLILQYSDDRTYRLKYYHMDSIAKNITAKGTRVEKGTYLGDYSNNKKRALCRGGKTTSPHVHVSFFKINKANIYIPLSLSKIKIGDFTQEVHTSKNYSTSCTEYRLISESGNQKICPFNRVNDAIEESAKLERSAIKS